MLSELCITRWAYGRLPGTLDGELDAAACGRGAGKASGGEYGSGKTILAVGCKNEFGRAVSRLSNPVPSSHSFPAH